MLQYSCPLPVSVAQLHAHALVNALAFPNPSLSVWFPELLRGHAVCINPSTAACEAHRLPLFSKTPPPVALKSRHAPSLAWQAVGTARRWSAGRPQQAERFTRALMLCGSLVNHSRPTPLPTGCPQQRQHNPPAPTLPAYHSYVQHLDAGFISLFRKKMRLRSQEKHLRCKGDFPD